MPGRAHHSEKWHRCWEEVQAKGHDENSAAAICTAQLKDESYVSRAAQEAVEGRELHLLGATGTVKTAMYQGREHLIVPVLALMEGVIHAVNSPVPEYVPADVVTSDPHAWNGRPAVVFHPMKGGRQCSANDPQMLESHQFGTIFEAYTNGNRLGMYVYADPKRLEALGQHELLASLRAGKPIEVSVGAYVRTEIRAGEFKGKAYKAIWRDKTPDHIAFLPGKKGACSLDMGCGAHRAAEEVETPIVYAVTDEGLQEPEMSTSITSELDELRTAIGKRHNASDQTMLQTMHDHAVALGAACEPKAMEGKYKDCPTCDGMGQKDGKDCPTCEGEGKIQTTMKKRYAEAPKDTGAKPDAAIVPQLKAACRCEETKAMSMTKEKRAELIAALVVDKHSGFNEGDQAFLETATDDRLEGFRAEATSRLAFAEAHEKLQNDQRNVAARLKVAEDKLRSTEDQLKTAQQKPTKEQWLEQAPAEIKALLEAEEKRNAEHRNALVTQIKTASQSEFTDEDLNGMDVSMLERLARMAKVEVPDYSGREFPREVRHAAGKEDKETYAPPNPYEAGIKALQQKMVN